jgi:hypothetical protein
MLVAGDDAIAFDGTTAATTPVLRVIECGHIGPNGVEIWSTCPEQNAADADDADKILEILRELKSRPPQEE